MARGHQLIVLLITALLAACAPAATNPGPSQPNGGATPASTTTEPAPTPILPSAVAVTAIIPAETATPLPTAMPTAATAPALDRNLGLVEPRMNGKDVEALQERLLALGYAVGEADGIFGPQTERAVIAFQVVNDLDVDGFVGPQTWAALFDPATAAAPEIVPVIDANFSILIGGVYAGDWLDAQVAATILPEQSTYELYGPEGQLGSAPGTLTRGMAEPLGPCDDLNKIDLKLSPATGSLAERNDIIGIGSSHNAAPRALVELPADQYAPFEAPLAQLLGSAGITEPETLITHAYQIDLEGDGTQETLIEAKRNAVVEDRRNISVAPGDYSLLAVIREDGTSITPIVAEYHLEAIEFAAPSTFILLNTLDLDGDGTLEIVLESSYYEGAFTEAYTIFNEQPQFLFGAGCGV
jgi:peptidoglycan hydrolase-like protein with peptidoglycan-binding domain